ncbi:unnamed protein product [Urochloa decumbens]|uniref:F-box domain-containing protein n=1 Tax=Urochloa decumbens TaxID=240449 RepID=A0ABC9FLD7_9POAL
MASMLLPELVEEILLRIPPDEPAHLVRAALVCKPWCRIISDGGFLRRYRRFHQSPPLLGYIHNAYHHIGKSEIARLVPTSLPSPVIASSPHCYSWWALDCRHGRVLIQMPTDTLVVWDPIAGSQQQLSQPPYLYLECMGAVLCATDGCDHLDCHGDPFVIVFVGTQYVGDDMLTWTSMYSSKTGVWSASKTSISTNFLTWTKPSLLTKDTLYFPFGNGMIIKSILMYDLCTHELSAVSMPGELSMIDMEEESSSSSLIKLEDGGLGVVALVDNCIYIWSRPDSIGGWVKHRVVELGMLLPQQPHPHKLIGFAEGTYTIFISTNVGIFALDLKSRQVRKVGTRRAYFPILPYMSFYTPSLALCLV